MNLTFIFVYSYNQVWQYYTSIMLILSTTIILKTTTQIISWLFHGYKPYVLIILKWLWLMAHAWIHNRWCAHNKPRHSHLSVHLLWAQALYQHTWPHWHNKTQASVCLLGEVRQREASQFFSHQEMVLSMFYTLIELEWFDSIFMSPKEILENHRDKVNTFNENSRATSEQ